jgi:hypothetical protein
VEIRRRSAGKPLLISSLGEGKEKELDGKD